MFYRLDNLVLQYSVIMYTIIMASESFIVMRVIYNLEIISQLQLKDRGPFFHEWWIRRVVLLRKVKIARCRNISILYHKLLLM